MNTNSFNRKRVFLKGTWAFIFQLLGYETRLAVLTSVTHHLSQIYGYLLGAAALLVLLFPFYKKTARIVKFQHPDKKIPFFWLWYTALVFAIAVVCWMTVSSPYTNNSATGLAAKSHPSGTGLLSKQNELPRGRIVYMKTDGIYVKELNVGTEKHVLGNASFPRWSPDGKKIAFVRDRQIGLFNMTDGTTTYLARAQNPRAVVFNDTGKSVFYTDGKTVFSVNIHSHRKKKVIQGKAYRELDVARRGSLLAVTVKEHFGYYVYLIDVGSNTSRKISRGCSASLDPDGKWVTVNGRNHLKLKIFDWKTGKKTMEIDAPAGSKFDNQFWSNHPDWIVSISEGNNANVYIHQVSSNRSWQVTTTSDCNRPDLYIDGK